MNKEYNLSVEALQDLQEIWQYIAEDNLVYADKVESSLYMEFDRLAKNPNIGHRRNDITNKSVRFWNLYSYQIIYMENTSPLQILRILSGYRDLANILED